MDILKVKTVWTTKRCQVAVAMHNYAALANPTESHLFNFEPDKIFSLICISKETEGHCCIIEDQDQAENNNKLSNHIKQPTPPLSYSAQPIQLAESA